MTRGLRGQGRRAGANSFGLPDHRARMDAPAGGGTALVISEFPRAGSTTGVGRRIDHLAQSLRARGYRTVFDHMNAAPSASKLRRVNVIVHAVTNARRRNLSAYDLVIVVGLGGPHLLALAIALSRRARVVFDACDSWLLQLKARFRLDPVGGAGLLLGALLQAVAPRSLEVSYISDRDRAADRSLVRGRRSHVIMPTVPEELKQLKELHPVKRPLERFVLVGDFSSYHNREGLEIVYGALGRIEDRLSIPVEVFGPAAPPEGPACLHYRGWAESLADVYRGNTTVIVTNVGGSGVPNKLVEAIGAGRPTLVHRSLADRYTGDGLITAFDAEDDLAMSLLRACGDGQTTGTR